jgi:hypothetical protein
MIGASFIGIFVIPPLYVFFQGLREWLRPSSAPKAAVADHGKGAPGKEPHPAE